jgi:hypothetical protein
MSLSDNSLTPPEPLISSLPNGDVEIVVGNEKGWVTSYHLVDAKVNQLNQAYLKNVS